MDDKQSDDNKHPSAWMKPLIMPVAVNLITALISALAASLYTKSMIAANKNFVESVAKELLEKPDALADIIYRNSTLSPTFKNITASSIIIEDPSTKSGKITLKSTPEIRLLSASETAETRLLVKDNTPQIRLGYSSSGEGTHKADAAIGVDDKSKGYIEINGKRMAVPTVP